MVDSWQHAAQSHNQTHAHTHMHVHTWHTYTGSHSHTHAHKVFRFPFNGSSYRRLEGLGRPLAAWRTGSTLPGNNKQAFSVGVVPVLRAVRVRARACVCVSVCGVACGFGSGLRCVVLVCVLCVCVLLRSCGHHLWSVPCSWLPSPSFSTLRRLGARDSS